MRASTVLLILVFFVLGVAVGVMAMRENWLADFELTAVSELDRDLLRKTPDEIRSALSQRA